MNYSADKISEFPVGIATMTFQTRLTILNLGLVLSIFQTDYVSKGTKKQIMPESQLA